MLSRPPVIVGGSARMADVHAAIESAAGADAKVLVTGESGVGKELVARAIHALSARAARPFVPVNCAGLSETLLESELFGHRRGSFTGAYRDKPGKLELAHGGTLFLDEVGDMSLRMQALLLRFLEDGEIQTVGAEGAGPHVDARVVAATNRNLPELVATGGFREDLLYRLRVIHIHVPPLRERRDDIRRLVAHFAGRAARPVTFSEEGLRALESYRWPGNIRELQNVVEQAIWRSGASTIETAHLPPSIRASGELTPAAGERRRGIAADLYENLVSGSYAFWEHIYPLFLSRDITRHDVRELVRHGLVATRGNYQALLRLFGMPAADYKRFLNFLAAHDCKLDFRAFRHGMPEQIRDGGGALSSPRLHERAEPASRPSRAAAPSGS